MKTSQKQFSGVDQYIAAQPKEIRETLEQLRAVIRKAAPQSEELVSYGMPAYKFHGILVYFGNFKSHYSFFPASKAIEEFKDQLKKYETSKGTIKFPYGTRVPVKLITDIVKYRVKENLNKELAKKTKKTVTKRESLKKKNK